MSALPAPGWEFEPWITGATVLVLGVYARGAWRRRARTRARDGRAMRHALFAAGTLGAWLAIESPLDALADHLFCAHQVQHLILLSIVPMLVVLAGPEATLIAGLGGAHGHRALAPWVASRPVRAVFGLFAHPVTAGALMTGVLYFWQVPRFHDAAVVDETVHDAMHATMLAAGMFFWWRVLDRRPPPAGLSYLYRLFLLKANVMMAVFLGAYLAAKGIVLYTAYDRLYWPGLTALQDERLGGTVLWFGGAACLFVGRGHRRPALAARARTQRGTAGSGTVTGYGGRAGDGLAFQGETPHAIHPGNCLHPVRDRDCGADLHVYRLVRRRGVDPAPPLRALGARDDDGELDRRPCQGRRAA